MLDNGPANRPTHPDFWKLSEQVLRRDGAANEARTPEEKEAVWDRFIAELGIDPDSVMYMASQRAMRVLGVTTLGELRQRSGEISVLTTLYIEGFQMGAEYEHGTENYTRKARS